MVFDWLCSNGFPFLKRDTVTPRIHVFSPAIPTNSCGAMCKKRFFRVHHSWIIIRTYRIHAKVFWWSSRWKQNPGPYQALGHPHDLIWPRDKIYKLGSKPVSLELRIWLRGPLFFQESILSKWQFGFTLKNTNAPWHLAAKLGHGAKIFNGLKKNKKHGFESPIRYMMWYFIVGRLVWEQYSAIWWPGSRRLRFLQPDVQKNKMNTTQEMSLLHILNLIAPPIFGKTWELNASITEFWAAMGRINS